jgi:hypothetical protein
MMKTCEFVILDNNQLSKVVCGKPADKFAKFNDDIYHPVCHTHFMFIREQNLKRREAIDKGELLPSSNQ